MLQAHGDAGYASKVEHSFVLALHFERQIRASRDAFVLVRPRSFVNVCFWWIPPALRPFDPQSASAQHLKALDEVRLPD